MKKILALSVLLACNPCFADADPCLLIRPGHTLHPDGSPSLCVSGNAGFRQVDTRLLGMQVDLLQRILKNQQELTTAVQSLAAATDKLAKTGETLVTSNAAWHTDVLQKTYAQLNAVPAALAQNAQLTEILSRTLADRLASDPGFVKRVKDQN